MAEGGLRMTHRHSLYMGVTRNLGPVDRYAGGTLPIFSLSILFKGLPPRVSLSSYGGPMTRTVGGWWLNSVLRIRNIYQHPPHLHPWRTSQCSRKRVQHLKKT